MGKGELVCFSLENNPIRLKSMNAQRHPQLQARLGRTPPALARITPPAESQPEAEPAPKPPPLQSWHFDPQLFRKWPQYDAAEKGAGEHAQGVDQGNEVSLGL